MLSGGRHSLAVWCRLRPLGSSTVGRRWAAFVDEDETAQEGMQQWTVHTNVVERTNIYVHIGKDNRTSRDHDRVGNRHVTKTQPTMTRFSQISGEISNVSLYTRHVTKTQPTRPCSHKSASKLVMCLYTH